PVDVSFIQLPEPSPLLAVGERESLHAPLLLELFDGAEYEAVVESVERTPRAVIWRGRIGGSTPFWVSRAGGSVLFTGQTPDGRTFEAAPGDDGQLRLMEIDDSKFEPEGEPVQRAESRGQRAEGQRAGDEGEAVIDVLFLY